VTGGAHDTLRDELAEALADYDQNEYPTASYGYQADALLPVVRRFADAQVAAERELADDLARVLSQTVVGWDDIIGADLSQAPHVQRVMARYRIARGQP
jgi:hypothetical protein